MGVRFSLDAAEAVGYLIGGPASAPRMTARSLGSFLDSLAHGSEWSLMSADPGWIQYVAEEADRALRRLAETELHSEGALPPDRPFLDSEVVEAVLGNLRRSFASYGLILLPVAPPERRDEVMGFAHWAANLPGHGILSLIPDTFDTDAVTVLEPGQGVRDALKRRKEWPGVIFTVRDTAPYTASPHPRDSTRTKRAESRYVPFDHAPNAVGALAPLLEDLSPAFDATRAIDLLDEISGNAPPAARSRILHLSDLHFGRTRAEHTNLYLQAAISRELDKIDRVVISGDLYDNPKDPDFQSYANFATSLKLLGSPTPIVVPGNHDQRVLGNALWRFGRRYKQVSKVQWQHLVVDEASQTVYLCFDSARQGDAARGEVTVEQLLAVAAEYDSSNAAGRFDGFLRVAVVHHHPYSYGAANERNILDPRHWPGRESLVGMNEKERFLTWCAGRGVSLVLHGHRHIPRLINDEIEVGGRFQRLTTVGCGTSTGANGRPLSFNLVDWSSETGAWTVDFRLDRGDGQGFYSAAVQSLIEPPVPV